MKKAWYTSQIAVKDNEHPYHRCDVFWSVWVVPAEMDPEHNVLLLTRIDKSSPLGREISSILGCGERIPHLRVIRDDDDPRRMAIALIESWQNSIKRQYPGSK